MLQDCVLHDTATLQPPMSLQLVLLPYRDTNLTDSQRVAVRLSIEEDRANVIEALLKRPEDPDMLLAPASTGLCVAAQHGSMRCLRLFLEAGASTSLPDALAAPPLHVACSHGQLDVAQALIEAGAEVDLRNAQGCTPIITAWNRNQMGMVQLLAEAGADLTYKYELKSKSSTGLTILHLVCGKGKSDNAALARALIDAGADVEAVDSKGN